MLLAPGVLAWLEANFYRSFGQSKDDLELSIVVKTITARLKRILYRACCRTGELILAADCGEC